VGIISTKYLLFVLLSVCSLPLDDIFKMTMTWM